VLDGMRWTEPDGAGQAWTLGFRSVAAVVIVVANVDVAVPTIIQTLTWTVGASITPPLDLRRCRHCAPPSFYSILFNFDTTSQQHLLSVERSLSPQDQTLSKITNSL
jgi:hypothetical protein